LGEVAQGVVGVFLPLAGRVGDGGDIGQVAGTGVEAAVGQVDTVGPAQRVVGVGGPARRFGAP